MSRFQFVRLCAVALLIFTLVECAIELVDLPNQIQAMTSFDLQQMTYSLLGIEQETSSGAISDGSVVQPVSFLQDILVTLFSLFLLSCQLLGAIGLLIVNREALGRFGRLSVRIWIFFAALGLVSALVPFVSSMISNVDNSVEQKLAQGVDSVNESLLSDYPIVVEALELLQTADIPPSYFTTMYGFLIVSTILIYTVLTFMAIKMWRDAKKFRYS